MGETATSNPAADKFSDFQAKEYKNADGKVLLYRLLPPENYDANQKYPLLVFMHGMGERGSDNGRQIINGAAEFLLAARKAHPCFSIAPQCPNTDTWANFRRATDPGNTKATGLTGPTVLVLELIASMQKEYSIDANRVYVGGLSMGGFGTWDLITYKPEIFAAAYPICGGGDVTKAAAAAVVPVWAFHGEDDKTVKPILSIRMVDAVKAAGGWAKLTTYPKVGHNSWTNAFVEPGLIDWIFAQKRGMKPSVPASMPVGAFDGGKAGAAK